MSVLALTDEVRAEIKKVVAFAEANRITLDELRARVASPNPKPVGDDPGRTIQIPFNYQVSFTIEQQPPPLNWIKHLSVSVLSPTNPLKTMPNIGVVLVLMEEFGMVTPFNVDFHHMALEDIHGPENDGKKAVNIMEIIDKSKPLRNI